jgi:general secretion pathway protein G
MKNYKNAFTMIELIFVIVILGILAAIAIPKFAATRTDAQIAKGRSDVAAIRSAIMTERQSRLIKGDSSWVSQLSDSNATLFTGSDSNHTLLMYGVSSGDTDGKWRRTAVNTYVFKVGGTDCSFTYDGAGKFTLTSTADICKKLVQ